MITLFESTETEFTSNGLGGLIDATECKVTEERNGTYELEMNYPVTGSHYSDLLLRRIIRVKPNRYSDPQPFRIYQISKPINGIVTVNAEHISYDLSGIPVTPFKVVTWYYISTSPTELVGADWSEERVYIEEGEYLWTKEVITDQDGNTTETDPICSPDENTVGVSPATAFEQLTKFVPSGIECPFSFSTDLIGDASFTVSVPSSIKSLLGDAESEGTFLNLYGGEYIFDMYDVKLLNARGEDRGVTIRYGKNLTDLTQEENCAEVYTGVYPYWYQEDDGLQYLGPQHPIIDVEGTFDYTRILSLDLTDKFSDGMPTQSELLAEAETYISENDVGIPKINLTVSFVSLRKLHDTEVIEALEDVRLCDTVTVKFPKLGVDATAKVIKTEYNCLTDAYDSIELGDATSTLDARLKTIATSAKKGKDGSDGEDGEDATYVFIFSSNGAIFKNEIVETQLTVNVYKGFTRMKTQEALVEMYGDAAYLQWYEKNLGDSDFSEVSSSDERLSENGFKFDISSEDVNEQKTFKVEVNDGM